LESADTKKEKSEYRSPKRNINIEYLSNLSKNCSTIAQNMRSLENMKSISARELKEELDIKYKSSKKNE